MLEDNVAIQGNRGKWQALYTVVYRGISRFNVPYLNDPFYNTYLIIRARMLSKLYYPMFDFGVCVD